MAIWKILVFLEETLLQPGLCSLQSSVPMSLRSTDCVTQRLLHGTANASAYRWVLESRSSP